MAREVVSENTEGVGEITGFDTEQLSPLVRRGFLRPSIFPSAVAGTREVRTPCLADTLRRRLEPIQPRQWRHRLPP